MRHTRFKLGSVSDTNARKKLLISRAASTRRAVGNCSIRRMEHMSRPGHEPINIPNDKATNTHSVDLHYAELRLTDELEAASMSGRQQVVTPQFQGDGTPAKEQRQNGLAIR